LNFAFRFLTRLRAQQDRVRRLTAEGGWILAGQIASVAGALVLVRVLTEYLTLAQYGELALGLTLAALVNQVVTGGLANGIARFFAPALEATDIARYFRASTRLVLLASLIILIFAILLILVLAMTGQIKWLSLAASALALSVLSGLNSILSGIQNAARQRATVALHAGLDAWLKIALAVLALLWIGISSPAVVVGFALSSLVVSLSQLWFLRSLLQRRLSHTSETAQKLRADWSREIWRFSWPFSTWGIFTWLQQVSDRWALGMFGTTAEVGAYAVVFQLGYTPIGLLTGLMMTLVGPILYARAGDASDKMRFASANTLIYQLVQVSLVLTAVAFASTLILHEIIFHFITSSEFRSGSYLLPWVVLAGGLFSAGQFLMLKLGVELRSRSMIGIKIGTAVLGIAANFAGARLFGVDGVVGALVIFSVVFFVWSVRLSASTRINLAAPLDSESTPIK
jgi:O-antigen/teichoic acid export membrane protein